ncbi:MAG TPA: hypothetical protein GX691_03560 [Clostridia bacterium]|jgi:hypothetical protein|nr:hypothetical protein [Clostridia bacterium]
MSNNGIELEMKPQVIARNQKLTGLDKGYVIPINVSAGKFHLIISEANPL